MPGESIRDYGSWVDLEVSGASIASGAFGSADDSGFNIATQGGSRPHLEIELQITFGTAPTTGAVALHHAPQDLFGGTTADGLAPSSTNIAGWLRSIQVATGTTSAQNYRFDILNAPVNSLYWLQNVATGQTISDGWRLRARAWSYRAAA